jgi:hypothetical protein
MLLHKTNFKDRAEVLKFTINNTSYFSNPHPAIDQNNTLAT